VDVIPKSFVELVSGGDNIFEANCGDLQKVAQGAAFIMGFFSGRWLTIFVPFFWGLISIGVDSCGH